jgi:NAD(P)-dependent dehydrogenase (short-subunit alcohol dehydrogenase family)
MKHLASSLGADRITVNAVAPGITTTDKALKKWQQRSPAEQALILAAIPLGRLGTIHDTAEAIAFLASDGASYYYGCNDR